MEDQEIINLFFARSEQAITELTAKYGALIFHVAKNIVGNEEDARECENDTYLGVWNAIPPQEPNPLVAFVCRIAKNLSLKKVRYQTAQKRDSRLDQSLEELGEVFGTKNGKNIPDKLTHPAAEEEWTAKELGAAINRFLAGLRKEDRILFVRRYWFCDGVSDLAEGFQISENSVSVKLYRIRKKLMKYLQQEGFEI